MWWKQGVIYQIYPRSFLDTNGDGIGDLEGIRRKLDYLADLGISGIWLSPVYPSPLFDFGYDISNYRDIDPIYGNIADFKLLIKEADSRGIKIIMDMVLNHSSHLHPWFTESRSSRDNPKRDWYIWHDCHQAQWPSRRPNNWMAAFGGHAWTFDKKTKSHYLHLFTEQQPDFNWRNAEFRKTMLGELRFWLDLGVKGFRLDVINYLVKDAGFRNNPYRLRLTYPRRYDMQSHRYDRNQDETFGIVRSLRELADSYGETMLVGEVYPDEGVHDPELAAKFLGTDGDLLHLAFDFSPIYTPFRAESFLEVYRSWYAKIPSSAWPCHVLSNHDQSRAISRLKVSGSLGDEPGKLLAAMLLTQRGTPFLYYGEEIGMKDGHIRRTELRDPVGKKYYPFHPGRDRSRTPMQWDSTYNGGFSQARPWLPVNQDYAVQNAAFQERDPASLLSFYRRLISLRKSREALHSGDIEFHQVKNKNILCYYRKSEKEKILVFLNFSSGPELMPLPAAGLTLLSTSRETGSVCQGEMRISPFEASVIEL